MNSDGSKSTLEEDLRIWMLPIVGLLGTVISALTIIPQGWKFFFTLIGILAISIYLWFRRKKPFLTGSKSNIPAFSEKTRSIALVGLIGIPFFLLGSFFGSFTKLFPSSPLISSQSSSLGSPQNINANGTYEWQWAGENWYGRITLDEVNDRQVITQARVGLIDKATPTDLIWMDGMVIDLVSGTYEIKRGNIEIELIVNKYDKRLHKITQEIITGSLKPTTCYAGIVTYKSSSTGDKYGGDMILVDYKSRLSNIVDDWFQQSAPLWSDK